VPTVRIAVTSTVILDVFNPPPTFDALVRDLRVSNEYAVGKLWDTVSGVRYTMVRIDALDVKHLGSVDR
jgi:hypothetical protein